MIEDLMTCLRIYRNVINGGYISESYKSKCDKVLSEIDTLEEMIKENKALNDFDFISLKRDVATVFHSDHFYGVPGIIDNPDDVLAVFFGTLNRINDCIKSGIEIKADLNQDKNEEQPKRRRSQKNYDTDFRYTQDDQVYQDKQDTVFTYISSRFNALFRNIPSNENDYMNILAKFQRKVDSYRNRIDDVDAEIESLRRLLKSTEAERQSKTSSKNVKEEYDKLCVRLYNAASKLYGILNKRSTLLQNRYNELTPLMCSKEVEFNAMYSTLIKEHEQLINDYNSAYSLNDKKQMKFLEKRIKEIEKEIDEKAEYIRTGLRQAISDEVIQDDYAYKELYDKYLKAKKRFEKADKNYRKVSSNPELYKDQIRRKIDKKYQNLMKKHSDQIVFDERARTQLEQGAQYYAHKIKEFENMYSQFAPSYSRSK